MQYTFKPARKSQKPLRMVLSGATNSGKTYTALRIATGISEAIGKAIAVIDTENYSSSLYANEFKFDSVALTSFSPSEYIKAMEAAEAAGYGVIIIDSATHAWSGKDGALERVDRARTKGGDPKGFTAWRDVTPLHNQFVEKMLRVNAHLITTLREKMEHVQEIVDGKTVVRRVGMAPIQRDGMEYEFDIGGKMDGAIMTVTKTRWRDLHNEILEKPDEAFGRRLIAWLNDGEEVIGPAPSPIEVDDRLLPAPRLVQCVKRWAGRIPGTMDEINAEVRRIVHGLGAQIGIDLTSRKAEPDECLRMIELLQQHQAAGRKPADLPAPKPAAKSPATPTAPTADTPTRGEPAPAASTPPSTPTPQPPTEQPGRETPTATPKPRPTRARGSAADAADAAARAERQPADQPPAKKGEQTGILTVMEVQAVKNGTTAKGQAYVLFKVKTEAGDMFTFSTSIEPLKGKRISARWGIKEGRRELLDFAEHPAFTAPTTPTQQPTAAKA